MPTYDVAHLREQGQDMIVVVVASSFGARTNTEQNRVRDQLQACARSAGLAGTVVPVWDAGAGRMGFLAPTPWQSFFRSLSLQHVALNINKKLTCQ